MAGRMRWVCCWGVGLSLWFAPAAWAVELAVVSTGPAMNATSAPVGTAITVNFNQPVKRDTFTPANFFVFGRWTGVRSGQFHFSNNDQTVTFQPTKPFSAGDLVTVVLSHDLQATDGSPLRSAGYSFQFWTRARGAALNFQQVQSMTTRTIPSQGSRAYGGIASDLNGDGWLDITIVNEDTADLRVFLNKGDGTGQYHPFLQPTFPVNDRASPSEPADFNRDGKIDICVANINANTVSILLGNGDGTFAPQQQVNVGSTPRGIAVLDVDGDGDMDIVNTNNGGNNCSLLLNNGGGVFGAPAFFEGGGTGEWALGAADMTNDGILDLVVGARTSQRLIVQRCNGNGTFTQMGLRASGGLTWMLGCGDLDNDGDADVAIANSTTNNGAILLGDGAGNLGAAQTYAADPFCLATELGDLDGDGDLDWLTSSYNGDWNLFLNDGDGAFTYNRDFNAVVSASCALVLDIDNDRDLDLALIDEEADTVTILKNSGTFVPGDLNCDGVLDFFDIDAFILALTNPAVYQAAFPNCDLDLADINGDGTVDFFDLDPFIELLTG